MELLKEDLKRMTFKQAYLLYGGERYLINHYARLFSEKLFNENLLNQNHPNEKSAETADVLMNRDTFDGKEVPVDRIMDAANTLPFMAPTRLVYVRESQLFTAGRKEATETMANYLPQIPESSVLVFVEKDVDKRNRLYKKMVEIGRAVEIQTPPEPALIKWVRQMFNNKGQQIDNAGAQLILRTVLHNMAAVHAEVDKISDYVGTRKSVTVSDITAVCSPSLETRIFDLVGAVGNGQVENALTMYRNMLLLKEQPIMILTMLARQFRLVLQCRACTDKRMSSAEITKTLGLRSFMLDEYRKQSRHFTIARLLEALRDCLDIDTRIKSGLINPEIGVETLIVRYAAAVGATAGSNVTTGNNRTDRSTLTARNDVVFR